MNIRSKSYTGKVSRIDRMTGGGLDYYNDGGFVVELMLKKV